MCSSNTNGFQCMMEDFPDVSCYWLKGYEEAECSSDLRDRFLERESTYECRGEAILKT